MADNTHVFMVESILWDTDGEYVEELPDTCSIPWEDLLYEGESLDSVEEEDLKERIADYLSDLYGWCVCSYWLLD